MKKNSTLILLVLAGLGIYWYFKNKNTSTPVPATSDKPTSDVKGTDVDIQFKINGFKKTLGNVPNTI
jgi:lipopolysaccharide export system protein LptC